MRMHESFCRRNGQVAEQAFDDVDALSRLIEVLAFNVGTIAEASYDKRYRQADLKFSTAGEAYGWSLSGIEGDEKFLNIAYLLVANIGALKGHKLLTDAMQIWASMHYDGESPARLSEVSKHYTQKEWPHLAERWESAHPALQRALVAALDLKLPEGLHYRDFTPQQILQAWYVSEGDSSRLCEALAV